MPSEQAPLSVTSIADPAVAAPPGTKFCVVIEPLAESVESATGKLAALLVLPSAAGSCVLSLPNRRLNSAIKLNVPASVVALASA